MRKILIIVGIIMLCGCEATRVVEQVPVYVHDTTAVVREVYDSIYVDRWHAVYVEGDTVVVRDSVEIVRWKERKDTVYVEREKPVVTMRTVEVEREISWLERAMMIAVVISLLVGTCLICKKIYKK